MPYICNKPAYLIINNRARDMLVSFLLAIRMIDARINLKNTNKNMTKTRRIFRPDILPHDWKRFPSTVEINSLCTKVIKLP